MADGMRALDAPPPETLRHPRLGRPSRAWTYRDVAGAPLFYVARFDPPAGKKEILPLSPGADGWRWRAPPEPRPLYGLDRLAARPDSPVLVAEGEKTVDAAAALFPSHVCITWPGGAQAAAKSDWSPLAGRRVVVWPDNDSPGRAAAAEVARLALAAGASRVAVVNVPAHWPPAWDLADPLPEGVTLDTLRAMLDAAAPVEPPRAAKDAPPALPPGFALRDDGLFWLSPGDATAPPLRVCGPLEVAAETRDAAGNAWGALLRWRDREGREHEWAMPRSLLAGDGSEVRAHLLDGGLFIAPSRRARERLMEYLAAATPGRFVCVTERLGWHDAPDGRRVFVLPSGAIGAAGGERVMLQTARADALPPLREAGTLDEWRGAVAALARGNSRLAFALSVAFAAPLLALVGAEGGGFHLRGPSSIGKTTALRAAGSAWGGGGLRGWVRSWRSTDNALEAVAAAHCDLLLCLDEMGEAAPEAVAAAAYMLANGAGKSRASRDGAARRGAEWRLLFLSTGEVGLADRLAEARGGPRRARAGQEIRVIDIPADTGRHGLFETLHGHQDARALADALRDATARFYGAAGRAWLERLAADPDGFAAAAREVAEAFAARHVPADASGQVRRVAARFGLVAAAGELAAGAGILPWPPGEAEGAAAACFAAWLAARAGAAGAAEDAAAAEAVRGFLVAHGAARFEAVGADGDSGGERIVNRAGWRKRAPDGGWRFIIPGAIWRGEVCAGLDPEHVARVLRARGWLIPQSESEPRHVRRERIGGHLIKAYVVSDAILGEGE